MPNFSFPTKQDLRRVVASFSRRERLAFFVLSILLLISTLGLLQGVNKSLMVKVPLEGGSLSEGIVGTPRFVNPVLASSPADQDMVALVYSGLVRKNGAEAPIPDLAEKYQVSENGLVYTFTLRDNIFFHNGDRVTADDILFTVDRVKNSVIVSPHKAHWEGVSAHKVDEKTLEFTLRQPNADFLESATLGILPKSLWSSESMELNEYNTMPVGSGPYRVKSVSKEARGAIDAYQLVSFDRFALGEPYIREINFRFYPNEEELLRALDEGVVKQASSVSPAAAKKLEARGYQIRAATMPRVFGLFLNQNQKELFLDKTVVRALDTAIDKERIVRDVLGGYGVVIDGPIPPDLVGPDTAAAPSAAPREEVVKNVRAALEKAGWKPGASGFYEKAAARGKTATALEFSIFTSNTPELAQTAELIKENLAEVGIKVDIRTFESGNLNQNVIRPRKYDALLFGQVVQNESDLFAFWHSSQRKDPGLNVAMYTNAKADGILEDAAVTLNIESRTNKYRQFAAEVKKDMPAVFLYSPDFIYVVSEDLAGFDLSQIQSPADRFAAVRSWFTKTEDVWKIFSKN